MEFDKGNMIINELDLDFILKRYIMQYRFKNDNKLPKKIIIQSSRDYVELTEAPWEEVQGKKVKIVFGGLGDTSGHKRTRGVGKSTSAERRGKSGTIKPTKSL